MKMKKPKFFFIMLLVVIISPAIVIADNIEIKIANNILTENMETPIYYNNNIKGIINKKADNVQNIITNDETGRGEVLDQSQNNTNNWGWFVAPWQWVAQGFTPTLKTLTKVKLYYFRSGNPSDTIQIIVSIRDDLYGNDIVTTQVNADQITHPGTWIDVDIEDITVVPEKIYYIVCSATGGDPYNVYCWYANFNNPYTRGDAWGSIDQGYTWWLLDNPPEFPQTDCCFKTYGIKKTNLKTTFTFIIGKIMNLNTIKGKTNFETLKLLYMNSLDNTIYKNNIGEKIYISDYNIGIINSNFIREFLKLISKKVS